MPLTLILFSASNPRAPARTYDSEQRPTLRPFQNSGCATSAKVIAMMGMRKRKPFPFAPGRLAHCYSTVRPDNETVMGQSDAVRTVASVTLGFTMKGEQRFQCGGTQVKPISAQADSQCLRSTGWIRDSTPKGTNFAFFYHNCNSLPNFRMPCVEVPFCAAAYRDEGIMLNVSRFSPKKRRSPEIPTLIEDASRGDRPSARLVVAANSVVL